MSICKWKGKLLKKNMHSVKTEEKRIEGMRREKKG